MLETTDVNLGRAATMGAGASESERLQRGATIGRFVVLDELGRGGMGVVYSAYDPELDRKVAVKVLHPRLGGAASADGRLRLLREAQALARVSHPNVIVVYDVGTIGDGVFLAMELVAGPTLAGWLKDGGQRRWTEVVARFREAGRGLAAAHTAGLVHRDFKPDNVLIGADGVARVTDFGLARAAAEIVQSEHSPSSESVLFSPLTMVGQAVGTLVFMAPEQLAGEVVDGRADQFSFSVALYFGLYGELPFLARSPAEQAAAIAEGQVRPAPARSRVPAWVRAIVLRGLRADPSLRYPSMDALLADLGRDPAILRRRVGLAGAALAVAAAVVVVARRDAVEACPRAQLTGIWDAPRRAAVRAAFMKTGAPFAADAWTAVGGALDGWAERFVAAEHEACVATRVQHTQTEAQLGQRLACLWWRRQEVAALVEVFAQGDVALVERAPLAVQSISPLSSCGDLEALLAAGRPPPAAEAAAVDAVRVQLARAKALQDTGSYGDSERTARQAAEAADRLSYLPVRAEARFQLALAQEELGGDFAAAENGLYDALFLAEEAGHDDVTARASLELAFVVGFRQSRFAEGQRLARHAEAILARLGRPDLDARLHAIRGAILRAEGKLPEARAALERALELRRRASGDSVELAVVHNSLGNVLQTLGKLPDARAHYLEAIALRERLLGPAHPTLAAIENNLGILLLSSGELDEALAHHRRALALKERTLAPDHPDIAGSWNNIGNVLAAQGKADEAVAAYQRALAIRERQPGSAGLAETLTNLGAAHVAEGRLDDAIAVYRRAARLRAQLAGEAHPDVGFARASLAEALRRKGQLAEAETESAQAVAILEKALGPDRAELAFPLLVAGRVHLDRKQARLALPLLERALALRAQAASSPIEVAEARFAVAQALWTAGGDRGRAIDLAASARAAFVEAGTATAVLDAWLATARRGKR